MTSKPHKIRLLLGYGIGDFGINIYWHSLSLMLVFWYAEVAGIEPAIAGWIYFIGLIWDAISDPIIATIAQRHNSRFGSYRPFILYGSFALGVAFCLLFWVPPLSGVGLFIYLTLVNMLFRTCYTIVAVPYSALSARLTYDSTERAELSGVRMIFAFCGMLALTSLWFPLTRFFSNGVDNSPTGFFITALFGAITATIALIVCFFNTTESLPLGGEHAVKKPDSVKGVFLQFAKAYKNNKALRSLLLLVFCLSGANSSFLIPLVFYLDANADSFAAKEFIMTGFALSTLFAIPFWTLLTRQIGKRQVWYFAACLAMIAGMTLYVLGPYVVYGIPLQILIFGISNGAFAILLWAIVPDVVEYGQYNYGERDEAAVFGMTFFVQKASSAFMGLCVGYVLTWVGYDKDLEMQTADVAVNIGKFLALTTPTLLIVAALILFFMPLTRESHAKIVKELSE